MKMKQGSTIRLGSAPLVRIRCYDHEGQKLFVAEYAEGPQQSYPALPPPTWEECEQACPEGYKLYEEGGSFKAYPVMQTGV